MSASLDPFSSYRLNITVVFFIKPIAAKTHFLRGTKPSQTPWKLSLSLTPFNAIVITPCKPLLSPTLFKLSLLAFNYQMFGNQSITYFMKPKFWQIYRSFSLVKQFLLSLFWQLIFTFLVAAQIYILTREHMVL